MLAGIFGFFALNAPAADGSITISGVVLPVNDLAIATQPGSDSLDLQSGATDQIVAKVNELANHSDGYTVTLVSANAKAARTAQARLKGADSENTSCINYALKYGAPDAEAEILLNTSGGAIVTSASSATPESGSTKNLKIVLPASTWVKADRYSDTIILTVSAR